MKTKNRMQKVLNYLDRRTVITVKLLLKAKGEKQNEHFITWLYVINDMVEAVKKHKENIFYIEIEAKWDERFAYLVKEIQEKYRKEFERECIKEFERDLKRKTEKIKTENLNWAIAKRLEKKYNE